MMPASPHRRSRLAAGALVLAVGVTLGVTAGFALDSLDAAGDVASFAGSPPTSAVVDEQATTVPAAAPTESPPTTAASTTTAPATTAPPVSTTTSPPPPPSYRTGDSGPEVAALQQRLLDLGFWVPVVDGTYGSVTAQAVMAFQKAHGLGRDGIAGPNTLAALATAAPVGPRESGDHVEIDLERQLMFVVKGDRSLAFNTSTGRAGWRTPPGRFTITREIDGTRRAPLGDLYRPKYFNGGIALHGAPSIPGYPASHGCARVHDDVIDLIWAEDLAPTGTPVWVY